MKKTTFLVLALLLSIKSGYSQNIQSSAVALSDTSQTLMTIQQLIKDARDGVDFINNDELINASMITLSLF